MSYYLNRGNGGFQESVDSMIHVDKTGLIEYTNGVLSTEQRFVFVSHPRRFGKTMAAEMLEAYYCRTCDSHAQFDGLAVSETEKYETHINRYDVVFFTMTNVLYGANDIKTALTKLKEGIADELREAYPEIDIKTEEPFIMFKRVYDETKTRFVFIIDEWDCPYTEREDDKDGQHKYAEFLMDLLKDREYVALAYMTGIFPLSCFRIGVDLNMFSEFSMENPGPVKEYFGFTESEVRALCDERGFSYEALDDYYNGYSFEDGQGKDLRIFNPWSVTDALMRGYTLYSWPNTIGGKYLLYLLENDVDGLHNLLLRLLNDERDITVFDTFHGKVTAQKNRRDVLTTLMHTGYLTDDIKTGLRFPNLEIRMNFTDTIEDMGTSPLSEYVFDSGELFRAAIIDRDAEKVCGLLKKIHSYYVSVISNVGRRTIADFVKFAFVNARVNYRFISESTTENGTVTMTFAPYKPSACPPVLMEFAKGSDDEARAKFAERFKEKGYKGKVLYIGINRKASKVLFRTHGGFTCKIEAEEI